MYAANQTDPHNVPLRDMAIDLLKRKRTCLGQGQWEDHQVTGPVTLISEADTSNNPEVQQKHENKLRCHKTTWDQLPLRGEDEYEEIG